MVVGDRRLAVSEGDSGPPDPKSKVTTGPFGDRRCADSGVVGYGAVYPRPRLPVTVAARIASVYIECPVSNDDMSG